jgi:hypothetical protein
MVEWFLFDRIDTEAGRASVRRQDHRVTVALAHEALPALTVVQLAVARAQIALKAAVRKRVPPLRGVEVDVRHRSLHFATV